MSLPPFQRLLEEHAAVARRFLVAAVGPDDADDCLQEALLSALRAYPRLREGSNERAWLLTIAHRKALDHHRARTRRPVAVGDALPERAAAAAPTIADRDAALWARVHALPPKQRGAVLLRVAGDLPHAEIARALGCSEAAARRSLHDGLAALRRALDEKEPDR